MTTSPLEKTSSEERLLKPAFIYSSQMKAGLAWLRQGGESFHAASLSALLYCSSLQIFPEVTQVLSSGKTGLASHCKLEGWEACLAILDYL